MGALASGPDHQTNVVREVATLAPPVSHGPPTTTTHRELRRVVVRTGRNAGVHTAQRVVAEYDRIYPAHLGHPRPGRSDAGQPRADHRLAGNDRPRLERRSHAVRMGWQTQSPSRPSVSTASSTRRIRSLHAHTNPSPPPIHGAMAIFRSSDPLATVQQPFESQAVRTVYALSG